ncbi:MAG: hypothetical protein SFW66_05685 [Gammaproteobacteria bacterium]|nr:hypothetical protein [Gammaproteobacteria bacterium]
MKNILATSLLLTGFIAITAQAGNVVVQGGTMTVTHIHTLKVTNTGSRYVTGNVTLHAGVRVGSTCNYKIQRAAGAYTVNPNTISNLYLDGDALASAIGRDYSCMDLIFQTDKQTFHDTFWLYSDSMGYYNSSPNADDVSVN